MATRTQIADAAFALLNVRENDSDVDTDNSVRARRFRALFDFELTKILKMYKWPFLVRSVDALPVDLGFATGNFSDEWNKIFFFPDGTTDVTKWVQTAPDKLLKLDYQSILPFSIAKRSRLSNEGIISIDVTENISFEYWRDIEGDTTLLPDTFAPVLYHKMASLLASPLGRPAEQVPQDVKYQQALQEMKLAFSIEEGPAHVIFDDTAVLGRFGGLGIANREGDGP